MTLVRALVPEGLDPGDDGIVAVSAAVALARHCGARAQVLIAGAKPECGVAREALALGAASVDRLVHPGLGAAPDVEAFIAVFADALRNPAISGTAPPAVTLLAPGPAGEEIAARLAARLHAAALGRCAQIERNADGLHATRAAFGGRAAARLRCPPGAFAVMRGPKLAPIDAKAAGPSSAVRRWDLDTVLPAPPRVSFKEIDETKRPLEGAHVVVSGGRGMGGPEGFALLEELAAALGGAVGGSLPTVDAGWVPVARQVGQSGKFVTPEIYVAVGISGTPQHLAGIGPETRIVAINKDAGADIFRVAEIGLVGEWKHVLPGLLAHLRKAAA